jgi:hypothetical protein
LGFQFKVLPAVPVVVRGVDGRSHHYSYYVYKL